MEKSSRPQRVRRHSRRAWPPEDDLSQPRLTKRLFTPEIKRLLKEWLIRRRENPYPSRDEKKRLAVETGLTYTQICNWFANWRRKLKNSEREKVNSWGHLIKHYNTNARGNVEQFSISSEDSIWEEEGFVGRTSEDDSRGVAEHERDDDEPDEDDDDPNDDDGYDGYDGYDVAEDDEANSAGRVERQRTYAATHYQCYPVYPAVHLQQQYRQHSCTEPPNSAAQQQQQQESCSSSNAKYKQKMMEKYLRDMHVQEAERAARQQGTQHPAAQHDKPEASELTKWVESAAKFTPNKNNFYIEWNNRRNKLERKQHPKLPPPGAVGPSQGPAYESIHHQDELEAAEALTKLAFNCRQRMRESSSRGPALTAISS